MSSARATESKAFTLLEVLVVMAVLAVLFAALVPALSSFSKSGGRRAAVSNLLSAIEQARVQAFKDGQATYVVFPDRLPASATTAMIKDYAYRSYAIFEDDPNNAGRIKQVSAWRRLPTGISIRSGSLNYLANNVSFSFTPLVGSPGTTFPYLKFSAEGQVDPATTRNTSATTGTIQFGVFEGFVDTSGVDRDTSTRSLPTVLLCPD